MFLSFLHAIALVWFFLMFLRNFYNGMQLIIIIKMIHLQGVNVDGDIWGSGADIREKKKKKTK